MVRRLGLGALALALAGCSAAPAYHSPQTALPAQFREGQWAPAQPARALTAQWWSGFGDATLDALEARALADNPDLAAAAARHRAALAALGQARAAQLPEIGAGAQFTNNRQSDNRPLRGNGQPDIYGAQTLGVGASYEIDLWGRVGNGVQAARADSEASADEAAAARLALSADLAIAYIHLRGLDTHIAILADTVAGFGQAAAVTHHRFSGGIASGIDVGRADAQLAEAQAQLAGLKADRAVAEHAIAVLVGAPASGFSLAAGGAAMRPLPVPAVLPAQLLERRPDVAAAERRMYAANRRIGVARAAWFPVVGLGGTVGLQDTAVAGLMSASNLLWALGPQAALTLFDGGRRSAAVARTRAQWDEAAAAYRGAVLRAVAESEDALARSRQIEREAEAETRAAAAASTAARLSYHRYLLGASGLLDLVTAQNAELAAREHAEAAQTLRLEMGVRRVRAMGGG